MGRLLSKSDKVPKHVRVLQMGDGVPLLGVDEVGEHQGVADEEDGGVVAHQVPVALLSVELDGEASGITCSVGRTGLTPYGTKPNSNWGLFSNLRKYSSLRYNGYRQKIEIQLHKYTFTYRIHALMNNDTFTYIPCSILRCHE